MGPPTICISKASPVLLLAACTSQTCPDGFAKIPADGTNISRPWCLAASEQKDDAGLPLLASHVQAQAYCKAKGYQLPTNALWQAMARNAEAVSENWEDGRMKTSVTLSNGERLLNVGDSLWEHIDGKHKEPADVASGRIELATGEGKDAYGPAGVYDSAGLGLVTRRSSPYFMRGGDDDNPGLFGLAMNHGKDDVGTDNGFRCAKAL